MDTPGHEYDKLVAAAWEIIQGRKQEIERVVAFLWEYKYRLRYLRWLRDRKRQLEIFSASWSEFSR